MSIAVLWAGKNLIDTGNVLGIKEKVEQPMAQEISFQELEAKYKDLVRNHNSLVGATEALQNDYNALVDRNIFLEKSLKNAQKAVDIQKQIMIDALTKQNEDKQTHERAIEELAKKRKLRS